MSLKENFKWFDQWIEYSVADTDGHMAHGYLNWSFGCHGNCFFFVTCASRRFEKSCDWSLLHHTRANHTCRVAFSRKPCASNLKLFLFQLFKERSQTFIKLQFKQRNLIRDGFTDLAIKSFETANSILQMDVTHSNGQQVDCSDGFDYASCTKWSTEGRFWCCPPIAGHCTWFLVLKASSVENHRICICSSTQFNFSWNNICRK